MKLQINIPATIIITNGELVLDNPTRSKGDRAMEALYDICDIAHAHCNDDCPVYKANGNSVPNDKLDESGCDCFKNGRAMLNFLISKSYV